MGEKTNKTGIMRHIYIRPLPFLNWRDNSNLGSHLPYKKKGIHMPELVNVIVGLFVVAILASALLPTALTSLAGASTSGWSASSIAMWAVIPIAILISIIVLLFRSVTQ